MIQQQTFIIALMNMFTHNNKNTCLYATPDAERRGILLIKILGTECPKCKSMASIVQDVVSINNMDATIEKVENIMGIMTFNVLTTPALVIDDVITIKGRVPSKDEVLALLT